MRRTLVTLITSLLIPTAAAAQDSDRHQITIYSSAQPGAVRASQFEYQANNPDYRMHIPGYALVRTVREMELERGQSTVRFSDVAAGIDPTTVGFTSLTRPDAASVLEQNYRYDLVSTQRILQRYIGQPITVEQALGDRVESVSGSLLSAAGDELVLQLDGGGIVATGSSARNIRFPALPDGLITQPTLEWLIDSERGGEHEVQVTYETRGMTWWADYNLVLDNASDCELDFGAWVTLVNQSGGSFADARLKLIAGDVNRASSGRQQPSPMVRERTQAMASSSDGFTEKSFFEYHLYTLGRSTSLPDRSIKQLELFEMARGVKCQEKFVFDSGFRPMYGLSQPITAQNATGGGQQGDVGVFLEFENREENALGMPLPAGRIRVSKLDSEDNSLEFIGEDLIDHTPRNEELSIELGNAFDIVGERRQADFRWSKNDQWIEETIEVELRNRKKTAATVNVRESLYRWTNSRLLKHSHEFEKIDASTLEFQVPLKPDATVTMSYTARYDW